MIGMYQMKDNNELLKVIEKEKQVIRTLKMNIASINDQLKYHEDQLTWYNERLLKEKK